MFGKIELEKLKFGLMQRISAADLEQFITSVYVSDMNEFMYDSIVIRLHGFVWGEKDREETSFEEVPADWWQAFKAAKFPEWLIMRYPVKLRKITTKTVYRVYPNTVKEIVSERSRVEIPYFW